MTNIADLFKWKIKYESLNARTFLAQADSKHHLTKSHFDKYSLMTSKRLYYLCFIQALDYMGKRLTGTEAINIQNIKGSMYKNGTHFNW